MFHHFENSSNILSAAYNEKTEVLLVEFIRGAKYLVYDVPLDIYEAFIEAPSAGSYFAKNIKGKFDTEREDQ